MSASALSSFGRQHTSPISTLWARRRHAALLDNLIRANKQRGRHGEPKRLGRFHVYDQHELSRALDGQLGGPSAFEDLIHVLAGAAEQIGKFGAIGRQSAIEGG